MTMIDTERELQCEKGLTNEQATALAARLGIGLAHREIAAMIRGEPVNSSAYSDTRRVENGLEISVNFLPGAAHAADLAV
jgi:hypothetical protein